MSRYGCNNSSIGTATHTVNSYSYYKNQQPKKSKYKCCNYDKRTRMCKATGISCVGCCSKLCKYYNVSPKMMDESGVIPTANMIVNSPKYGIGMILSLQGEKYKVKYYESNFVEWYNIDQVRKILLKQYFRV